MAIRCLLDKKQTRQIAVGAIVSGANPIPRKPRGRSGGGELRQAPQTGPFARTGKIVTSTYLRRDPWMKDRTTTRFERRVWEGEAS